MYPLFSMRKLRASRFMRVMALFAWVMLLATSLPTMAMGTGGDMPATMGSMMGHDMQHATSMGTHQGNDCCGNTAHPVCHCDAMCGNVLFPAMPALFGASKPIGSYASFRGIDAPTLDPIPPLRPPAA